MPYSGRSLTRESRKPARSRNRSEAVLEGPCLFIVFPRHSLFRLHFVGALALRRGMRDLFGEGVLHGLFRLDRLPELWRIADGGLSGFFLLTGHGTTPFVFARECTAELRPRFDREAIRAGMRSLRDASSVVPLLPTTFASTSEFALRKLHRLTDLAIDREACGEDGPRFAL